MIKFTAKIISAIFLVNTTIAAPTLKGGMSSFTKQMHQELMSGVVQTYNESSADLSKAGLKAFSAHYGQDFTDFDQAFLSTKIRGLNPLPKISVQNDAIEMQNIQNGKNQPIRIEIVDARNKVFSINGKLIKIDSIDTLEEVYKKTNVALGQPAKTTFLDNINDSLLHKAYAVETSTWIVGGIIAIAVGIILYRLGKQAGEKKIKDKNKNGTTTQPAAGGVISEENPSYLEAPGTDVVDQSTDVITPGH